MTRTEMLACLNGRPCDVCKCHTETGCKRWNCVFEEEPDEDKNKRFEGMTNGEVIQALFPNVSKYNNMLLENHSRNILFDDKWWNALYQKGGE